MQNIVTSKADTGFSNSRDGYGYFILGHFVVGHIIGCADKTSVDKMLVDKMLVKIAREDKMLAILWNREEKMVILSKHLIYHTNGQVN